MSYAKKLGLLGYFIIALVCLQYLVKAREIKEVLRTLNFLEDKYKSMPFEQVVRDVKNWQDAENYLLGHLRFNNEQSSFSLEEIHFTHETVCFGGAKMAKKLLSDNDDQYEVGLYIFKNRNGRASHMFALIKDKVNSKYGSLGINACDCIFPKYKSKEEVFSKINGVFFWKGYKNPEKMEIL